jgi:hypothetical protein
MQTGNLVNKNNYKNNYNNSDRDIHGNQKIGGNISSHGCLCNEVNNSKW